jgi:hypothetical protein
METVLRDLDESFRTDRSFAVDEEAAEIPHPYRAYYIEGQRSVVDRIRQVIKHAHKDSGNADLS